MIVTVFDTETTGLISSGLIPLERQPYVIEFCAITVDLSNKDSEPKLINDFLVKAPIPVSEKITEITNITNAMLENEKPFSEYIDRVMESLENCDAVIAHNLAFDKEIIDFEMKRNGQEIKWPRLICTVEQSMPLKGYRLSLADLHRELTGGIFEGAHRAKNDVEALVRCAYSMYDQEYI